MDIWSDIGAISDAGGIGQISGNRSGIRIAPERWARTLSRGMLSDDVEGGAGGVGGAGEGVVAGVFAIEGALLCRWRGTGNTRICGWDVPCPERSVGPESNRMRTADEGSGHRPVRAAGSSKAGLWVSGPRRAICQFLVGPVVRRMAVLHVPPWTQSDVNPAHERGAFNLEGGIPYPANLIFPPATCRSRWNLR